MATNERQNNVTEAKSDQKLKISRLNKKSKQLNNYMDK